MPKKLDIEPRLTTLPPPSRALASRGPADGGHPEGGEEIDGHDLFEHLGVVLAAATGQVLTGVVDEHVEAGEGGASASGASGSGSRQRW